VTTRTEDERGTAEDEPNAVAGEDAATPGARPDEALPDDAIVVRTPTRRVDVTGADRSSYLEDVTSQAVTALGAGGWTSALYLDPHGAPLAMFDLAVLADRIALLAPDDGVADTLVGTLGNRTFLLDATFSPTEDVTTVLRGGRAAEVAAATNLTTRPGTVRPAGDELYVLGREDGQLDVVGPEAAVAELEQLLVQHGARRGDDRDLEDWRVAAGVPSWGREVVAPHLPEEAGVLPTHVHLGKGCYPGQEAVARMWMLGRPRRRLAVVAPVGGVVEPGWTAGEGRRAATVTSVAPTGGRALAFVPGDATPGDAFSDDAGVGVEVVRLVGEDAAPPGHDPATTRRRDRPRA
jgi:tRNA-modifying protein YgfZ